MSVFPKICCQVVDMRDGGKRQLPWLSLAALLLLLGLAYVSSRQRVALAAFIETQELEVDSLRNQNQELQSRVLQIEGRSAPSSQSSANGGEGAVGSTGAAAEVNAMDLAALMQQWEAYYGLNATLSAANASWTAPEGVAVRRAPHLQDCSRLERERQESDSRGANGSAPPWAHSSDPRPPWVAGSDEDNLPLTREAQAAIWRHQNPANCRDPSLRFLIASWPRPPNHGLGSALHIMTLWLAAALTTGRVLVTQSDFLRSKHEGCPGWVHGRLDCYFYPLAPQECTERALQLNQELHGGELVAAHKVMKTMRDRSERVLAVHHMRWGFVQKLVPGLWGSPWEKVASSVELWGEMLDMAHGDLHLGWWRAQGIRYLLRWPSKYMCAITNRARHESYGAAVASELLLAAARQARYVRDDKGGMAPLPPPARPWDTPAALESSIWRHETSAYIPRPIVNVHVRQGDKGKEMALFSLASYLVLAEKLRAHVPNMRHIWLSTEMQSVVDDSAGYDAWTMLYTRVPRMLGKQGMSEFEASAGVRVSVENALVNLLISVECDYFIGALGSNWPRIINELRLTNGRQRRGYVTTTTWKELY